MKNRTAAGKSLGIAHQELARDSPLTLSPLQRVYHNGHNDEVEQRLFQYLANCPKICTIYTTDFDYDQNAEECAIALSAIRNSKIIESQWCDEKYYENNHAKRSVRNWKAYKIINNAQK